MKEIALTIFVLTFSVLSAFSQKANDTYLSNSKVLQIMETDTMPTFKGGYDALLAYIDTNLVYPDIYNEASIQGRIICKFIVMEDGSISNLKILQGIDNYIDNEVAKVISSMPKWLSGKKNGKPVKVEYFLPIICRIK